MVLKKFAQMSHGKLHTVRNAGNSYQNIQSSTLSKVEKNVDFYQTKKDWESYRSSKRCCCCSIMCNALRNVCLKIFFIGDQSKTAKCPKKKLIKVVVSKNASSFLWYNQLLNDGLGERLKINQYKILPSTQIW